jgi:hypothetical protein
MTTTYADHELCGAFSRYVYGRTVAFFVRRHVGKSTTEGSPCRRASRKQPRRRDA